MSVLEFVKIYISTRFRFYPWFFIALLILLYGQVTWANTFYIIFSLFTFRLVDDFFTMTFESRMGKYPFYFYEKKSFLRVVLGVSCGWLIIGSIMNSFFWGNLLFMLISLLWYQIFKYKKSILLVSMLKYLYLPFSVPERDSNILLMSFIFFFCMLLNELIEEKFINLKLKRSIRYTLLILPIIYIYGSA